ncbi:MAG: hypothetical protein M1816_002097 [Peltula sp. TS41687]|nr:MAG: hypothetical protein M1816_002097 [Peltula sp. TS41687]
MLPIKAKTTYHSTSTVRLSALDQAMSKLYVRHFLCFPYRDTQDKQISSSLLAQGLQRTAQQLAFLNDEVVVVNEIKKGWVELHAGGGTVSLVVKDYTESNQIKTYAQLVKYHMPSSELDGDLLAPCGRYPDPKGRAPVIAAQVNFIRDGVILCLCPHHSVLDAVAFGTLWRLWAQNTREITELHHRPGRLVPDPVWVDKTPLSIGSAAEMPEEVLAQVMDGHTPSQDAYPPEEPAKSVLFLFSADQLAELKRDVRRTHFFEAKSEEQRVEEGRPPEEVITEDPIGFPPASDIITTNDALCALLWCCINDVRHERHLTEKWHDVYPPSTLGIAVDIRSRMRPHALPKEYLGNAAVYMKTYYTQESEPMMEAIAQAAWEIRRTLGRVDDWFVRDVIAHIEDRRSVVDLPDAFFPCRPQMDLAISSWAKLPLYELDWGSAIADWPTYVRLPRGDLDHFCIILPKRPDGSLEVLLSIDQADMDKLRGHETFSCYALRQWESATEQEDTDERQDAAEREDAEREDAEREDATE